jgi:hypothetical protein
VRHRQSHRFSLNANALGRIVRHALENLDRGLIVGLM